MRTFVCVSVFLCFVFCFFYASAWHRKLAQVLICILSTSRSDYISQRPHLLHTHKKKQSLSLRHDKALAYIPSARSSLLLLQHIHGKRGSRKGCQPVRQTSSLPGPSTDGSVGHVSRGKQKAQTASQQSPGTASACEGLIEQEGRDRVPRSNGVEADMFFSYAER